MKQQINFYPFLPKPPPYRISERLFFRVVMGLISLLLLVTFFQFINLANKKSALAKLQKEYTQTQTEASATGSALEVNSVENLRKELLEKQKLLENLQARKITSGNCALLSNYFTAFAEETVPGLWLNNISVNLNADLIILTGSTYSPGLVLDLVKALNNTPCFSERQFGPIEMHKQPPSAADRSEKKEVLRFVVNSGSATFSGTKTQTGKIA